MRCSLCKSHIQIKAKLYRNVKDYLEKQPRFGESFFRKLKREVNLFIKELWQEVTLAGKASYAPAHLKPETIVRLRHLDSHW